MSGDLDRDYSPSMWTKRFNSSEEALGHFVKFGREKTAENCKNLKCELNVSYGDSNREKIDIFGTDLPKDAPLFVFVHGGYWQLHEKEISGYPAKPLVEKGIKVMVVEYDLCPKVTIEEIIKQIQKAGKFIFNYCKENGIKKLSISGHSSGAHLISYLLEKNFVESLGENFNILKSMIFVAGVYDVKEGRHLKAVNENNILSITDENENYLSPIYHDFSHLSNKSLNYHIIVGQYDSPTFIKHSESFHKTLSETSKLKGTHYEIYQDLDHFNIVEKLTEPDYKMTKLIIQELN